MSLSNDLSCEAGSFSCCRPTPTGVFTQRFEALFRRAGALGYVVCFPPRRSPGLSLRECGAAGCYPLLCLPHSRHSESGPLGLSVCECGAAGSASGQTAFPVGPTLRQSQSRQGNVSPLCPGCPSPPLLPVWMTVSFCSTWCRTSLPFVFSVSSGCVRRRSVSTYAAILVLREGFSL